ncbi:hypothetical protein GCM10010472_27890 [Pseudonocardia halophobica]|uniref:Uncharacterized protein n=1 Tax=Pseudonocardia halophobica TaxID=29401 RepID=A0A9W6KXB6_9PSEU|nr:hypothetical protein [Pseudonocardia halophobica]GLL09048.1 hypothetical protein GCM10017577_01880 [Pseudonocardia halophobica]
MTNSKSREIASSLEATPIVAQPERFAWILALEPEASLRNARRHVPQLIELCESVSGEPRMSDESSEVRWVDPAQLDELDIHPSVRLRIDHGPQERAEPSYT